LNTGLITLNETQWKLKDMQSDSKIFKVGVND